jgi:hypothetical protein
MEHWLPGAAAGWRRALITGQKGFCNQDGKHPSSDNRYSLLQAEACMHNWLMHETSRAHVSTCGLLQRMHCPYA